MNDWLLIVMGGFVSGLLSWFALYKLIFIFNTFMGGIDEAFRND